MRCAIICANWSVYAFPLFRSQQFCKLKRARTQNSTFSLGYCTPFSHPKKNVPYVGKYARCKLTWTLYTFNKSHASKQTLVDGTLACAATALELLLMKHRFNAWGEIYKNLLACRNKFSSEYFQQLEKTFEPELIISQPQLAQSNIQYFYKIFLFINPLEAACIFYCEGIKFWTIPRFAEAPHPGNNKGKTKSGFL
jgi:hypothetical protein